MLGVPEPGALNFYTFSRLNALFESRNLTLTHLPLSESLDSLLSDLIAPTPGRAFSLHMLRTLAVASSFLWSRAYSSRSSVPPLFLRLTPTLNNVGISISLNDSFALSFLNVYARPICSSPTDSRTDSFSPSIYFSSRNFFILGNFNCHHPLWDSRGTSDSRGEEVFDWVISSDLLPLNDSDIPTLLLWQSLLSWHFLCSLLSRPLLLLGGTSGPGFWSPINSTNHSSLFGPSPQLASLFLQFSESSLAWLCFLLWLSLSFCRRIFVSFSFLCCCSFYFSDTECGQIFHSFRSHQTPS